MTLKELSNYVDTPIPRKSSNLIHKSKQNKHNLISDSKDISKDTTSI